MTTIQIDKQALIRACALSGIEHGLALRIFANLIPAPAEPTWGAVLAKVRANVAVWPEGAARTLFDQMLDNLDTYVQAAGLATPPISDDMRGAQAGTTACMSGNGPYGCYMRNCQSSGTCLAEAAPAPTDAGNPISGTGSQVHPNMALPHKRSSDWKMP